ncbi:hypothetical protein HDV05_006410 [Chytridiales sp. JEL 0842]|nr:hypothetical protein HDV05_006410 [Chytridiales sp. JEL 0842]
MSSAPLYSFFNSSLPSHSHRSSNPPPSSSVPSQSFLNSATSPPALSASSASSSSSSSLTSTTTSDLVYRIQIFPHRETGPGFNSSQVVGFNFPPIEKHIKVGTVIRIGRKVDRGHKDKKKDKEASSSAAANAASSANGNPSNAVPHSINTSLHSPTAESPSRSSSNTSSHPPHLANPVSPTSRLFGSSHSILPFLSSHLHHHNHNHSHNSNQSTPSSTTNHNHNPLSPLWSHVPTNTNNATSPNAASDSDPLHGISTSAAAAGSLDFPASPPPSASIPSMPMDTVALLPTTTTTADEPTSATSEDPTTAPQPGVSTESLQTPTTQKEDEEKKTDFIAFRSKVVSRTHAELWVSADGQLMFKDVGSSSGTFVNRIRLSPSGKESRPHVVKSGDVIQLGVDYQGRQEEIYKCVLLKVFVSLKSRSRPRTQPARLKSALRALLSSMNPSAQNPQDSSCTECCICLSTLLPVQALFLAPCSHCFHYRCVMPLLGSQVMFQCPLCRQVASLEAGPGGDGEGEEWEEGEETGEEGEDWGGLHAVEHQQQPIPQQSGEQRVEEVSRPEGERQVEVGGEREDEEEVSEMSATSSSHPSRHVTLARPSTQTSTSSAQQQQQQPSTASRRVTLFVETQQQQAQDQTQMLESSTSSSVASSISDQAAESSTHPHQPPPQPTEEQSVETLLELLSKQMGSLGTEQREQVRAKLSSLLPPAEPAAETIATMTTREGVERRASAPPLPSSGLSVSTNVGNVPGGELSPTIPASKSKKGKGVIAGAFSALRAAGKNGSGSSGSANGSV